jgi:hypothetical protein
LLSASAPTILLPARGHFGACDSFLARKTWAELSRDLEKRALAVVLLTGDDLARVMQASGTRADFFHRFCVVGDFVSSPDPKLALGRRIFIIMPRGKGAALLADRMLVLMECKSIVNAVKTLLHAMPDRSIQAEQLPMSAQSARAGLAGGLVRLTLARPIDGICATSQLLAARRSSGASLSILGIYQSTEDYAAG